MSNENTCLPGRELLEEAGIDCWGGAFDLTASVDAWRAHLRYSSGSATNCSTSAGSGCRLGGPVCSRRALASDVRPSCSANAPPGAASDSRRQQVAAAEVAAHAVVRGRTRRAPRPRRPAGSGARRAAVGTVLACGGQRTRRAAARRTPRGSRRREEEVHSPRSFRRACRMWLEGKSPAAAADGAVARRAGSHPVGQSVAAVRPEACRLASQVALSSWGLGARQAEDTAAEADDK